MSEHRRGRWTYRLERGVLLSAKLDGGPVVDARPSGAWDGMADPRFTGIGSVGLHVLDPPWPGERLAFERARHVENLREDAYAVLSYSQRRRGRYLYCRSTLGFRAVPILEARTRWRLSAGEVAALFDLEVLPDADGLYGKEPKIGAASIVGVAGRFDARDRERRLVRTGRVSVHDPKTDTAQVEHRRRRHLTILSTRHVLRLSAGGIRDDGLTVLDADDPRAGLGLWRARARQRLAAQGDPDPLYCWSRVLRPSWEVIAYPGRFGALLHAWTGGRGFHDCPRAYRLLEPGLRVRYYLRVALARRL